MRLCLLLLVALLASPIYGKPSAAGWPDSIEMPLSTTLREYQDWRIEQSSAFVAAVTTNKDGSFFGLLCGKTCSYYINIGMTCEVGSAYPGVLNAAGNALPITLRCLHLKEEGEDYAVMLIDEEVSDALNDAKEISIAVPLRNGQFEVSRFSMAGSQEARKDMLDIAVKKEAPGNSIL